MSLIAFRLLIVLGVILLPMVVQAQFSAEYAAGSYVLRSQPSKRHYGQLKLQNGRKLLVKSIEGGKHSVKAEEALSCSFRQLHYAVASGVQFRINSRLVNEKDVFAQKIDSGSVILLRYDHLLNTGFNWLYIYRYPITVYLLKDQSDVDFFVAWNTFDKSIFQRQVRRFLMNRPDLVKLLDDGLITYQNFPNAIRALNHNLSFQPSDIIERKE